MKLKMSPYGGSPVGGPNKKILIVGLGNPGEKYENSPHNSGFLVIDKLLETYNLKLETKNKLKSEVTEYKFNKKSLVLARPITFMNDSGIALKQLVSSFMFQVSNLWLVHDDVDLELGQLKIVKNRGSAGHKGVEDVIQKLRTKDFIRFRVGIRPKHLPQKRSKSLMNKFVVGKFTKGEDKIFRESIAKCKEAIIFALENGIEKAMGVYNQK